MSHRNRFMLVCPLLSCLILTSAYGAEPPIVTDDLLSVKVVDLVAVGVTTDFALRVQTDGTIYLPPLGTIKVAGVAPADASKLIDKRYLDAQILRNAKA